MVYDPARELERVLSSAKLPAKQFQKLTTGRGRIWDEGGQQLNAEYVGRVAQLIQQLTQEAKEESRES